MARTLKLLLNIGTRDAQALGLEETQAGAEVSVDAKVADELISRGWAAEPDQGGPAPQARPSSSVTPRPGEADTSAPAAAEAVDFESMTKAQLQEYADARGYRDVSMDQTKADMIAAIEDAETTPR